MIRRLLLVFLIVIAIAAFFAFDLGQYFTLESLRSQQQAIDDYYRAHPVSTLAFYFLIYVLSAALALPVAVWLTLAGGAVFGLWTGVLVISFASSIGALCSFLVSRFLLRDWVQRRFSGKLRAINRGIEKDGGFYLFTLRLVPIFPFWVINVTMGLTPMRALPFYLISQLGMFPATVIYVNAGTELAKLTSTGNILSPTLVLSLTLLGLFPLIAKKTLDMLKAKRVLRGHTKPKRFDRDMVVIGAGSAGLVCAYLAAALRAKVTLIEKNKMGGDCLNTGCVPSKTLLRTSHLLHEIHNAKRYGIKNASAEFDFADIMQRVQQSITAIEPHDSVERYTALGVDVRIGDAHIVSPYHIRIDGGETLSTRNIVVATGARPFVPALSGLDSVSYSTSDTIWDLRDLPQRLVVLGGGPIGCELAQGFARLGSDVTIVEQLPQLLQHEDQDIAERVYSHLTNEGIHVHLQHRATAVEQTNSGPRLICECDGVNAAIPFDHLLIALGRKAYVTGYGLEELDVQLIGSGTLEVNDYLQTSYPNIYACGDVVGQYHFTHTASHQAWYATINALFGRFKKFRADYSVIPWATFTDPEVARVGLNEHDAKQQKIPYEVTTFNLDELDRAIVDSAAHGIIKVLTVPGKDRILGVTIVGNRASEWIVEFVSAMKHRIGLNKVLGTIHIYPTFAEANKYVAGAWKRAHAPQFALSLLEKLHRWQRG